LVPNELVTNAGLTKNVVIIGVGNKIEIWDETKYQKFVEQTTPMYETIVERLDEQNKQ
jgi:MraZ protein